MSDQPFVIHAGDSLAVLCALPDASIHCCITSPPYYGLRDYGVDGQIGLEPTPDAYIQRLVDVFREVRRVLRDDGTLWVNIGDSYSGQTTGSLGNKRGISGGTANENAGFGRPSKIFPGLKPKDLIGIPWMLAFALRADGWYLRQDIIWCLSGGTWLYVRTQKGDMPMTVKDLSRLNPDTVQLWNGEKWTQLLGMSKSKRRGDELEIVLRSGERISCTPTHRFPTTRGVIAASELECGDVLEKCQLPEAEMVRDCVIDEDAAWFAGLYIAEGSRSGDTIQIAGHVKEQERWGRVQRIAAKFGGYAAITESGNKQNIRVYGKILNAIIDELVTGRTAKDKGFAPVVWRYSNLFLSAMLDGYLSGDGHWDEKNDRWRLGFTHNYNLERDLRTVCARLGYRLTLKMSFVQYNGRKCPTFRGEIRKTRGGHHNECEMAEVVEIRKARCREVYDLGVQDEPHLFALASGVLTHNSKPNPMPESVKDRCTKAHEYIFMLSKSARYWWDADAVSEECGGFNGSTFTKGKTAEARAGLATIGQGERVEPTARNKRSVWTLATLPTPEAHFATFPIELPELCLKAGCPEGGTVLDPFSGAGTTGLACLKNGRQYIGIELNPKYVEITMQRARKYYPLLLCGVA